MKTSLLLIVIFIVFLADKSILAQDLEGLWMVDDATVGDESMTPVARWTRINSDGTYESGNGWLQNAKGHWVYDVEKQSFLPKPLSGINDPFGPFKISVEKDRMQWQRTEDGQLVKISYKRIEDLPMAPADKISGLWDLTSIPQNGEEVVTIVDPEENYYIFFRWDRIFVERNSSGERETGYWHMNGHRPHLTMLSHREGREPLTWEVFFEEDTLRMKGLSDSNKGEIRSFIRMEEFPG